MVRWVRWHCPPDTGFEIRALAVWGRARYLSVTETPHNTDFHTWMGKKHFCFLQTAETGNRTPNSGVEGSGANHYPRAPALSKYSPNVAETERETEGFSRILRSIKIVGIFLDDYIQDLALINQFTNRLSRISIISATLSHSQPIYCSVIKKLWAIFGPCGRNRS